MGTLLIINDITNISKEMIAPPPKKSANNFWTTEKLKSLKKDNAVSNL